MAALYPSISTLSVPVILALATPAGVKAAPIRVDFDQARSVGTFLSTRDGDFINDGQLVYIGEGQTVYWIEWDVEIEVNNGGSLFSEAGVGLLNIGALPWISRPKDAPSVTFGASRYDDGSGITSVRGVFDLESAERYEIPVNAAVPAYDGYVYIEVFELFDDNDDYGVTNASSLLEVDAWITGSVLLYTTPIPAPASMLLLGAGAMSIGGWKRRSA